MRELLKNKCDFGLKGIDRTQADAPNEKWVTDVTEFRIPAGRACLSPIVGCFDGMPPAWPGRCRGGGAAPATREAWGLIGRPETGLSCGCDRGGAVTGVLAGMPGARPGWHGDAGTRGDPGHGSPTRHGRDLGSAARTWARRQGAPRTACIR